VLRPVLRITASSVATAPVSAPTSPFGGDAWRAAEAACDPSLEPVDVSTGDAGLAAYKVASPVRADLDPATYLQVDCCSDGSECGPGDAPATVDDLTPVLVLGSPSGRLTDFTGPHTGQAADALVDAAVDAAGANGCRAVLAPWCTESDSGALLRVAFEARGALVQRRGYAHAIDLGRTFAGFTAGLPRPVRLRREREAAAARSAGYRVERLTPDQWGTYQPLAAVLAAELDAGGALAPDHAGPWALLGHFGDAVDPIAGRLHVWAAFHGDQLRGCAGFVLHGDALWLTFRALGREPRGFPTGLYFHLVLDEAAAAAEALGVTRLEYGVSTSGAWVLRGCAATPSTSCLLPLAVGA
jgi:hypothetical protein